MAGAGKGVDLMAILIGLVSLVAVVFGVLSMMASIVPSYGSRSDGRPAFALGLILSVGGIAGVFYAGSWL